LVRWEAEGSVRKGKRKGVDADADADAEEGREGKRTTRSKTRRETETVGETTAGEKREDAIMIEDDAVREKDGEYIPGWCSVLFKWVPESLDVACLTDDRRRTGSLSDVRTANEGRRGVSSSRPLRTDTSYSVAGVEVRTPLLAP
jgi:hypothetical protein